MTSAYSFYLEILRRWLGSEERLYAALAQIICISTDVLGKYLRNPKISQSPVLLWVFFDKWGGTESSFDVFCGDVQGSCHRVALWLTTASVWHQWNYFFDSSKAELSKAYDHTA